MYSEEERAEILSEAKAEKLREEEDQLIREYNQKKLGQEIEEYRFKIQSGIPIDDIDIPGLDKDYQKRLKDKGFGRIV